MLSSLEEIKIGIGYRDASDQLLPSFPADVETLQSVNVVYETLPGWMSDISEVRSWDDLPINAQKYVERIEALTGIHCRWIGVGPGRDAMLLKPYQSHVRLPHLAEKINRV